VKRGYKAEIRNQTDRLKIFFSVETKIKSMKDQRS